MFLRGEEVFGLYNHLLFNGAFHVCLALNGSLCSLLPLGGRSGFCKLAKQSVKGGSSQRAALLQSFSQCLFSPSFFSELV